MKIFIKLLIRFIKPHLFHKKRTWFSMKYSRVESELRRERFKTHKRNDDKNMYFHVHGAGHLSISKYPIYSTGEAINGYSIGVEWGEFGFAGGVISREDAIALANHIHTSFVIEELKQVKQ